jgi:hypothetical protein
MGCWVERSIHLRTKAGLPSSLQAPKADCNGVFVWIEGYWAPTGHHYKWVRGHWEHPPFEGAYWVHPHYDHYREGWQCHKDIGAVRTTTTDIGESMIMGDIVIKTAKGMRTATSRHRWLARFPSN